MKILITGASGFIGGHIVAEALRRGYDTWAAIRPSSSRERLSSPAIHLIELPYHNPTELRHTLRQLKAEMGGWDYIIHNLGVTKCNNNATFEQINYHYVRHLVESLTAEEMLPQHFVFVSSLGACGVGDEVGFTPRKLTDPLNPCTYYGKSKLLAEEYLQQHPTLNYTIVRFTGVYGTYERDYLELMRLIQRGIDIQVGFAPQRLTFIYVTDAVAVLYAAIDKGASRKVYFASDGNSYTPAQFKHAIMAALGKRHVPTLVVPLALVKALSYLGGWRAKLLGKTSLLNPDKYLILKQRNYCCDLSATQRELGYTPHYTLDKGVAECVAWYREQGWL